MDISVLFRLDKTLSARVINSSIGKTYLHSTKMVEDLYLLNAFVPKVRLWFPYAEEHFPIQSSLTDINVIDSHVQ